MHRSTVLLLVFALAAPVAATKPDAPLPRGLPIEGKPVGYLRFSDDLGVNLLVVTETAVKSEATPEGDEVRSKRLFGYQFRRALTDGDEAKSWRLLWQTKDFVLRCPFDLELRFLPGSLGISDVDEDGVMETRFAYTLGCRSDVTPWGMKLLLHEGKQKYAVRGSAFERVATDDGKHAYLYGEHELDPAFEGAPKGFAELAEREWAKLKGR